MFGAIVYGFPDGCTIRLENGVEIPMCDFRKAEHADVILVRAHYATGNGLSIGAATTEEFFNPRGGGYFVPAPITRGASGPSEGEWRALPEEIRAAYNWYFGRVNTTVRLKGL